MSSRRSRKRGRVQADHVEPVVQVLAEPAGADQGLEVLVGRRQDPDVDRDRLRAADPLEGHLLEHAEQLGLDLEVDVADLVEEERAAVGLLEPADPVAIGPGEGPLDVAEQLALQQALRQRGAVDLDERPRPRAGWRDGSPRPAAPCRCRSRRGSARPTGWRPPCGPSRSSAGRPGPTP